MSGMDEQLKLRCSRCGQTPNLWLLVDLGLFNLNESVIVEYGIINSRYFDKHGLDKTLDVLKEVKCSLCNATMKGSFVEHIKHSIKLNFIKHGGNR